MTPEETRAVEKAARWAAGRLSGLCHDDREEVTQLASIHAWQALPRYDGRSTLLTFLCGVAWHAALDWQAAEERRRRRFVPLEDAAAVAVEPGRLERFADEEELRAYARAERMLPPRGRRAVRLRLAGCSVTETAAKLSCSRGAVKNLTHRAVRQLQAALAGEPGL